MKAATITLALVLLRPVYLATPTGAALVCALFGVAFTFAVARVAWRILP